MLELRPVVKTFLRELEKILARMTVEQRRRVGVVLGNLINGISGISEALPGLSKKAWTLLIADLTMFMSMGKKGPAVLEKARAVAKEAGPHVDAIVSAL
jgi:hypothetical protein